MVQVTYGPELGRLTVVGAHTMRPPFADRQHERAHQRHHGDPERGDQPRAKRCGIQPPRFRCGHALDQQAEPRVCQQSHHRRGRRSGIHTDGALFDPRAIRHGHVGSGQLVQPDRAASARITNFASPPRSRFARWTHPRLFPGADFNSRRLYCFSRSCWSGERTRLACCLWRPSKDDLGRDARGNTQDACAPRTSSTRNRRHR